MSHHISQTMSQEGSSQTGTGSALEEPEWRYNRKEDRFIVTFKASVSVEQEDGTTLVRAAHRTTPDNLLCAWEEQAKEAGLKYLRKATKGKTGVSVLKDKLAQVFKSASQEWWESLSGVNLVTITENPGSPNAERVPGTRKYLDVPLTDGEVDLECSSQPKCKTLRLKVIGLREHQYRIPVPTLTYIGPDRSVFLEFPLWLDSTTGGPNVVFSEDCHDISTLCDRMSGSLSRVVFQSIESLSPRTGNGDISEGPISRHAMQPIDSAILHALLTDISISTGLLSPSRSSPNEQIPAPNQQDIYTVDLSPVSGEAGGEGSLYTKYRNRGGVGSQSPPILWLSEQPYVAYTGCKLTLHVSGCLTSTAPGALRSPLDQVPTAETLQDIVTRNLPLWDMRFLHNWEHWSKGEVRNELAHWLAEDLCFSFYHTAKPGELQGFGEAAQAVEGSANVPCGYHEVEKIEVHWTPKHCGLSLSRP